MASQQFTLAQQVVKIGGGGWWLAVAVFGAWLLVASCWLLVAVCFELKVWFVFRLVALPALVAVAGGRAWCWWHVVVAGQGAGCKRGCLNQRREGAGATNVQ